LEDKKQEIRDIGGTLRAFLEGFFGSQQAGERETLGALKNPSEHIVFGPEARKARLYTEIFVAGNKYVFEAGGSRFCSTNSSEFRADRGTLVYNLTCSVTYFAADDTPLGPIRIVQDPRIENRGWIYLRRNKEGHYELPGLSFFNQHLIFHVGDRFFYYPRAWQVVSAILDWPPEYHQYHHLEEDTPIFDFITGEPNVARKGVSTISIEGRFTPDEERRVLEANERELEIIRKLPAHKMSPEDLTSP